MITIEPSTNTDQPNLFFVAGKNVKDVSARLPPTSTKTSPPSEKKLALTVGSLASSIEKNSSSNSLNPLLKLGIKYEWSIRQYACLWFIAKNPGLTRHEIAAKLDLTSSVVQKTTIYFEKLGYLKFDGDANRKNSVTYQISDELQELLAGVIPLTNIDQPIG